MRKGRESMREWGEKGKRAKRKQVRLGREQQEIGDIVSLSKYEYHPGRRHPTTAPTWWPDIKKNIRKRKSL